MSIDNLAFKDQDFAFTVDDLSIILRGHFALTTEHDNDPNGVAGMTIRVLTDAGWGAFTAVGDAANIAKSAAVNVFKSVGSMVMSNKDQEKVPTDTKKQASSTE